MPDHVHLLVEATSDSSDLSRFVQRAKQMSAYHAARVGRPSIWQTGYHERTIRRDEDPRAFARYIVQNPVSAGIVVNPDDYPHSWSEPV
jgi:putative transposase